MSDRNTRRVRYHSSDDMQGVGELASVMEPVAVVVRPDGSLDVYGYIGIVDQRAEALEGHNFSEEPDAGLPHLKRALCSCGWTSGGYSRIARTFWDAHLAAERH